MQGRTHLNEYQLMKTSWKERDFLGKPFIYGLYIYRANLLNEYGVKKKELNW